MSIFQDLLRIPTISTSPNHTEDMKIGAKFLADYLTNLGFENACIYSTPRHPIVYAEWMKAPTDAPTLLIYGHYDVQPPDPLDEWTSEPFNPTVRDDYLFARGASDMKGQVMATIFALESILKASELNINIKYILEGEEEIGSPSLDAFMEEHKDLLNANFVLNPDAGMIAPDRPTIVYGLRGLAYFELRINGPKADLHSGLFGGIIHNPAIVMSEVISRMHDQDGKVTLPGFYENVKELSQAEREKILSLDLNDTHFIDMTGVPQLYGEKGYTQLERIGARPTLDVNGLYSGFIGEGGKTIIPAFANAKISCRLVPDQDPKQVNQQMIEFLNNEIPSTVTWKLTMSSGAPAYKSENVPGLENFISALETVWDKPVAYKREGGSVPVATSMKNILGLDSILTGFGLPDDQIHSPNERLHLPTWQLGIKALILFLLSFSK
ncbi:MAG: dipeptidase [Anaerolineaceae bacterium]|nr:dipeptidase [Anaerolineaceae bacterium]